MSRAAVIGGGISGRLIAWELSTRGWRVTLFERNSKDERCGCSQMAAGMLCPLAELDTAEPIIARWGFESLKLWPSLLARLDDSVYFQKEGSLAVCLPSEKEELSRLGKKIATVEPSKAQYLLRDNLQKLEPELDAQFTRGLYFPMDAQIDARQCLSALHRTLASSGATLKFSNDIKDIKPYEVDGASFDAVVDCRGLGAQFDGLPLRGVRGELFLVHAPDVHFHRPIRLLHRTHPLYAVPRPDNHFLLGATCIESESLAPVSLRSSLELLSMALQLHPGFSEANLLESRVQLRPAFPNNLPKIFCTPGLTRINGLYRHGYLLGPAIARAAANFLEDGASCELIQEVA